jgi:glycosyltransferase involved in cell wall biosynthesis
MAETDGDISVCVASYNSRAVTELCIRSMARRAGVDFELVVGDSASADGSAEMLGRFAASGVLALEAVEAPRKHADWLDQWYSSCKSRYLVFSDSDVEYRGDGWLLEMVQYSQSTGAAVVAGRIQPDWTARPRTADGRGRYLPGARPEPCLMLLDLAQLRGVVDTSFEFMTEPLFEGSEQTLVFDVGGAFLRSLLEAGLRAEQMPTEFQRKYRHWGGLTARKPGDKSLTFASRSKQTLKIFLVRARLWRERIRDKDLAVRCRLAAMPSSPRP